VAEHAYRLAQAFSKFYAACPILQAEPAIRGSRLALAATTLAQLVRALDVLGISVPERIVAARSSPSAQRDRDGGGCSRREPGGFAPRPGL